MTDQLVKIMGPVIGGLSAVIASAMALVSWSYDTFETKEIGKERLQSIERRLERIETKIDSIRERN